MVRTIGWDWSVSSLRVFIYHTTLSGWNWPTANFSAGTGTGSPLDLRDDKTEGRGRASVPVFVFGFHGQEICDTIKKGNVTHLIDPHLFGEAWSFKFQEVLWGRIYPKENLFLVSWVWFIHSTLSDDIRYGSPNECFSFSIILSSLSAQEVKMLLSSESIFSTRPNHRMALLSAETGRGKSLRTWRCGTQSSVNILAFKVSGIYVWWHTLERSQLNRSWIRGFSLYSLFVSF